MSGLSTESDHPTGPKELNSCYPASSTFACLRGGTTRGRMLLARLSFPAVCNDAS